MFFNIKKSFECFLTPGTELDRDENVEMNKMLFQLSKPLARRLMEKK